VKKLKSITRNGVATVIAASAGVAAVACPFLVIAAIWTRDVRWTWTGLASLGLGVTLVVIGYILFDDDVEAEVNVP
jgi:hypothetical protein